jgi:hypothetical protein
MSVDTFNIEQVAELNKCGLTELESGVAILVELSNEKANIFLEDEKFETLSPSLWHMLELHNKVSKVENPIVEIEL